MLKTFAICVALSVAGLAGVAACSNGSSEKAGEKADAAVDKALTGKENKGDGPLEKTGEAIDKMDGHKDKDPIDALHDATDKDKSTKPN